MPDGFLSQEEIDALLGKKDQTGNSSVKDIKIDTSDNEEESPPNLALILDFPLVLSIRLGEVKKNLNEVRKISPGVVVELNRGINDPVEIYTGGKLIARGEVVVIEENFGIKITHIIEPVERIKKLG
ncbi:MAG: FliM/FliN family flagellar motor switch protein [Bacillota bacterium]|nr:FliM/FliN family flagellar motor switch protein [Bacillota bacterium]